MKYFQLVDKLDSKFSPFVPKFTNIVTIGGCPKCSTLPVGAGPPSFVKVEDYEAEALISFTSWGFGVISDTLLDALGEDAADCLKLGNILDSKGAIVSGFHTFVGKEHVVLRGNRNSQHRICEACGAFVCTYMPRRSPYLTPAQVSSQRAVYEIESMQLLVSEAVKNRIRDRWPKLLTIYNVPVVEKPTDGLPADMTVWPSESQIAEYRLLMTK